MSSLILKIIHMSNPNEQFNLEQMFLKYLNLVGLKIHEMSPVQLIETKRAFIGGCGQTIILFTQELSDFTDEEATAIMDNMVQQISDFWQQEKG